MDEKRLNCSLELAYPPEAERVNDKHDIVVLGRLYYAKLAAFDRYLYRSVTNSREHPILSDIYDCIGICELKHFKMLGHILTRSDALPAVRGYVGRTPGDDFESDIAAEEAMSLEFAHAAAACRDESLAKLYSRLALDEEHHAEILSRVKKRYKGK